MSAVWVNGAEPENFIPPQSPQLLRANANSIIRMEHFQQLLKQTDEKCRKVFLLLDEMKKHNIEPAVFFAGEMWAAKTGSDDKNWVVLVKTALPEAKFAEFFKAQKASNKDVELEISTLAGKTIYTGKYSKSYQATGAEPFFVVYMAEDVIAFMPLRDDSGIQLAALQQGGGNPLARTIDRKSLAALAANALKKKDKLRSIRGKLDMVGAEKLDICAEAVLTYKSASVALRKAMEMQFIIPTVAGLLFGNDQKLMEEITAVLQIVPAGEKIGLKLNITKALQDKIAGYLANPANMPELNFNSPDPANNMQP